MANLDSSNKSKWVTITGSSNGIGAEIAKVFSDNRYNVILHGRNVKDLYDMSAMLDSKELGHEIVIGDLADKKTIKSLVDLSLAKNIECFINNAGYRCPGKPFNEINEQDIIDLLEINLLAKMKLTNAMYAPFVRRGYGSIINLNSIIAFEPKKNRAVYTAGCYGMRGFEKALSLEANEHNVHIMNVYVTRVKTKPEFEWGMEPGFVAKEIYDKYLSRETSELILDGRPEEFKPKKIL